MEPWWRCLPRAGQLGSANRGGPYRLYRKVTADRQDAAVAEHRALEIARLDALQAALRPKAIDGDVQAGRHGDEDR